MPFPEPVSWDRKEIYRDRRPVKSESLGSSPVASRWNRDSSSFSYRGNHHGSSPREFSRRGFMDYRRSPGRGRQQSDWKMFPEEAGYGYMPSRSCERVIEDRSYWTSSSSRVDGRYRSGTDYYKVRGYQKEWEGPNWPQNNPSSAVSAGKPFNGSTVFYGGKPCDGLSDMPVERKHIGIYPGFGTERQFNASPVICNGRPNNDFGGSSVEKSHNGYSLKNGYSPRNGSDRPFSLSPLSGDKQSLVYSNPHFEKSRNGYSSPSVVKTHNRISHSFAAERPNNLLTSVSEDRAGDVFSSASDVKAYDRLSPRTAADRSNNIAPAISRPCFAPISSAIEKTGYGCSDIYSEKIVDGCSSSLSAERPIELSSSMSRDTANPDVSVTLVEKTPYNLTSSLADGDESYLKPFGTPASNRCNGLAVVSKEKHDNEEVTGRSSTKICDGISRSTVTDLPEMKNDGELSNYEHGSDCLLMVSENPSKQHHDVEVGEIIESCNVLKHEKENFLGADWKCLIWTRSGSLSSRAHSGSSRSAPVDSKATVDESLQIKSTGLCSPSGNAEDCLTSSATSSKAPALKKARLGWGQGLAKYEKKIVEDPCVSGKQDNMCSPTIGFRDKCTSPSTPTSASATCSFSQDNEFKILKEASTPDSLKLGVSDNVPSSFEKLDLSVISSEVYLLLNTIHSEDHCPAGFRPESTNAMSKLLVWKTGILKAVEMTDSEIESLESEIQPSKSESSSNIHCPAASSLFDANAGTKSDKTIASCSAMPMSLQVDSSGMINDIDSPGTATSNPVIPSCQVKSTTQVENPSLYSEDIRTKSSYTMIKLAHNQEISHPSDFCDVDTPKHCSDNPDYPNHDMVDLEDSKLQKLIFAANNKEAGKAYDELAHLLSKNGTSVAVCQELHNDMLIRYEIAKRKKLCRFTEKLAALKYRALQKLWKEDARLLELRKNRPKSYKHLELGTRTSQSDHVESNLLRPRVSSTEGSSRLVPSSLTVGLTSKLLPDCPIRAYKDELRMPPLILEEKEKQMSRFVSYNGLAEDPFSVEKERAVMNPWTPDEKETFLDKFAIFGKDFRKIASYLDHKTTADCVVFYYKNHRSSSFERTKKKPARVGTQSKPVAKDAYMLTSGGQKWDQESAAADVLARISCSISSEAISPCVSSSFNQADVQQRQWKRKKVGARRKQTWTHEVSPINDETCSGESCGEMDFSSLDWTDEEKHMLLQAVKLYGNNFELVSKVVKTRYSNECKAFYSKVKKRLVSTLTTTNINTAGIRLDSKPDIDVRLSTLLQEPVL